MGIIKDKLYEQIEQHEQLKTKMTTAVILSYDHHSNTATIAFNDPTTGGLITANNVKVQLSGGGLSSSAPLVNQKCWILFMNNSLLTPIIVSLFSEKYFNEVYAKKTTTYQGGYVVDAKISSVDTTIPTTPMVDDWLDPTNTDVEKYCSINLSDYINTDIDQLVYYLLTELNKYKEQEDGITNLKTNSTVKTKDNGDIDIFVDGNVGLRICKETRTIQIFSDHAILYGNLSIHGTLTVNGKEI